MRGKRYLCPVCCRQIIIRYKLIAFSNVQFLDAEFTESALLIPGTDKTIVGNTPAFAPDFLLKGGLQLRKDTLFQHHVLSCLRITAILAGHEHWQRRRSRKRKIAPYKVFNLSGEFYLTTNLRLIAGITNLTDEKYYDRVFANGIEPAPHRSPVTLVCPWLLTEPRTGENNDREWRLAPVQ